MSLDWCAWSLILPLLLFWWVQDKRADRKEPQPLPRCFSHQWWRDMWQFALLQWDAGETRGHTHAWEDIVRFCYHRAWDRRLKLERQEGLE